MGCDGFFPKVAPYDSVVSSHISVHIMGSTRRIDVMTRGKSKQWKLGKLLVTPILEAI